MCGRFSRHVGSDVIIDRFEVEKTLLHDSLKNRYNIAPSGQEPVVFRENPVVLRDMLWGFVPFWADSINPDIQPINTRKDSLFKNMYKHSFEQKRCIIPSTGFYEWKETLEGKVPHYIRLTTEQVFGFAGIYSVWSPKDSDEIDESNKKLFSFSIITCEPNKLVAEVHNRMPVILTKENEQIWLDPKADIDMLHNEVLQPYPHEMEAYAVSRIVNNPSNDSQNCIEPSDDPFKDPDNASLDDFFD